MEGLREEREQKSVLGVWNLGAGGCRGDVIGSEHRRGEEPREKQASLSIQILFAIPAGGRRGGVGAEGGGWQSATPGAAGKR